jgi:predicted nucleotidyltransferase component of viral defense system
MAVQLTRALVARHGAGRADTYDAALLDVAQDHLLWLLSELGLFNDTGLVFKAQVLPRRRGTILDRPRFCMP